MTDPWKQIDCGEHEVEGINVEVEHLKDRLTSRLRATSPQLKLMVVLLFVSIIVAGAISQLLTSSGMEWHESFFLTAIINTFAWLFVGRRYAKSYFRDREIMITSLNNLALAGDSRALSAFAEASCSSEPKVREAANEALLAVLSQVVEEEWIELTPQHRNTVRESILDPTQRKVPRDHFKRPSNSDRMRYVARRKPLALALLKAYERVGNADDVPAVTQIANGSHPLSQDAEINTAAVDCLICIIMRAENQASSNSLLRATDNPVVNPTVLLRPAGNSGANESGELLRREQALEDEP